MMRLFHRAPWVLLVTAAGMFVPAANAATLRLGGALAQPGQADVAVAVTLEPGTGEGVAALQFDVPIDEDIFTEVTVVAGPVATAASKQVVLSEPQPGRWRIIVSGFNQNTMGAGVVASLLLDVSTTAVERAYLLPPEGAVLSNPAGQRVPVTALKGAVYVGEGRYHSADTSHDNAIVLSELLRVIQFYNYGALHCDAQGEDGFAPGPGAQGCTPHDSDFLEPRNWSITLSELLRLIQFYNSDGYFISPASEDGFAPDFGKGGMSP